MSGSVHRLKLTKATHIPTKSKIINNSRWLNLLIKRRPYGIAQW